MASFPDTDARALEERLGVRFSDPSLLQRAFLHSSHLNENPPSGLESNERLEFLGDAVLGQAVALLLFRALPGATEGELTRLRAALVRRETLTSLARDLDLGAFLVLGRGEEASGGRARPANLANALEAVIGALYLDQGEEAVGRVIEDLFSPAVERFRTGHSSRDAKSHLQEIVQGRRKITPAYRIVDERGPSHERQFTVEVLIGNEPLARGTGPSKRAAEQDAARAALLNLEERESDEPTS